MIPIKTMNLIVKIYRYAISFLIMFVGCLMVGKILNIEIFTFNQVTGLVLVLFGVQSYEYTKNLLMEKKEHE